MDLKYEDLRDAAPMAPLDLWLRFDPRIEARFEAETRDVRVSELRHAILYGVLFIYVYVFTDWALMPDALIPILVIRIGAITPSAALISVILPRVGDVWRERLALVGMVGTTLVLMTLLRLTHSPLAPLLLGDLTLCVVYANMNLPLRFRHATIYSVIVCLAAIAFIWFKTEIDARLRIAAVVQFATATAFTLYANYHAQRRSRSDYLAKLTAQLRSQEAELAAERLADISETDPLSGLPNRRHLDRRLEEWFGGAQPIALAMIDVDHFKAYNDSLGHPAGDECLREIGAALNSISARGDVLAARYGGEEFTVAARGADELEARRLALRIVKTVRALELRHPGRADGLDIVTVSVGVGLSSARTGASKAELFAAADGALYEAKRRGRNRYVYAEPSNVSAAAKA